MQQQVSYSEKLDLVIKDAWKLFKLQYLNGRFSVDKEAPFQHYFANVLKSVGELYCFTRTEQFIVDLETKEENIRGRTKYIDITISFYDRSTLMAKAAVELKYKKKSQGADDFARIDSYEDIESLEHCLDREYQNAYFFMISDYDIYARESRAGTTGNIFSMRNGYIPPINEPIRNPNCKGRQDVVVTFKRKHTFNWETWGNYIFLCLPIH